MPVFIFEWDEFSLFRSFVLACGHHHPSRTRRSSHIFVCGPIFLPHSMRYGAYSAFSWIVGRLCAGGFSPPLWGFGPPWSGLCIYLCLDWGHLLLCPLPLLGNFCPPFSMIWSTQGFLLPGCPNCWIWILDPMGWPYATSFYTSMDDISILCL